ncbi:hypothetical protein FJZ39_03430 [Candidatus Saccharibacteria bacterium]|nr:hypothetical protein [Candidatus Saccharibacteria bacterium]
MSLQTGAQLAVTDAAVIDPRTLKIVAYKLIGQHLTRLDSSYLMVEDIRETGSMGFIVDSQDVIVTSGDVIHLQKIIDYNFYLEGMRVIDTRRQRLGKVHSYTIESGGFVIQQLSVQRPLIKSFTTTSMLIHRSQIVKISDSEVTVRNSHEEERATPVLTSARAAIGDNPFRKGSPADPS